MHHQCTPADQLSSGYAAQKGMLQEATAHASPGERPVDRQLAKQQARNRVWRLSGPDRSRHSPGDRRGRSEPVVADDPALFMDHHDDRETALLVSERTRFQPVIKRRLAGRKIRYVMVRSERLGRGEGHEAVPYLGPLSQGALRLNSATISGTGFAGPEIAATKALKPAGDIRIGALSMIASSAARTAASRTKSVRERPRRFAARSMIAMSDSGRRIDSGWSFRAGRGISVVSFSVGNNVAQITIRYKNWQKQTARTEPGRQIRDAPPITYRRRRLRSPAPASPPAARGLRGP